MVIKKTGIMFYPGATYSGSVEVVNAGFVPENVLHNKVDGFGRTFTYTDDDIDRLVVRTSDSNKGTYGRTLIIAGSKDMGVLRFYQQAQHTGVEQDLLRFLHMKQIKHRYLYGCQNA